MGLSGSIIINVPDLPDADVWFANSAAWTNYWKNLVGEFTFNGAATTIYVPVPFDNTLPPKDLIIDSIDYVFPSIEQFNSLQAQVAALDQAFQALRTQLKDAGFITQAQ